MNEIEKQLAELERLAAELREQKESWSSPSGLGDRVSGIRVVGPDGAIKQEWHNE